jgi:non-heme chloroperoxidase
MAEVVARSGLLAKTRLHVDDPGGRGRPVVLIHGWPLSGESWAPQLGALAAAGFRPITYDRRGFGRSEHPGKGYDYNTLASDLDRILTELDLWNVTLVGFSMGGGEVARYIARYGESRLLSVVFASSVTPYLLHTDDNPDGPLEPSAAADMTKHLTEERDAFYDQFVTDFFSVNGQLKVTEEQRRQALAMCAQADQEAALATMAAWGKTDFRRDLEAVTVPALVIHGSGDATVPFAGSGRLTHDAIPNARLALIEDAPHGLNVSHAAEFNQALLSFLGH